MGSPSSTMGMGTKLLLGLALLGLVVASPLPEPLPLPQPILEPLGLIGRLLGLQGSGTQHTLKKPKPFKPEEECICERTFHKKPDKKKKKPKNPCDCYGAPESGYGAPSQPPLTTYTSPCKPGQPPAYQVGRRRRSPNHPTKSFDFFGDGGIFSPELAADFHTLGKKKEKKTKHNPCNF